MGAIGQALARRAKAFGMTVSYSNRRAVSADIESELGAERLSLDEMLATSDIVSINCPYSTETHHLIGPEQFEVMRSSGFLINTARGPIVDGDALHRALAEQRLGGAALDDLPEEPAKQRSWRPDNPLLALPNCLVTPHVAYYSEESIHYARTFASEEVVRVLRGEPPRSPVNLERLHAPRSASAGIGSSS